MHFFWLIFLPLLVSCTPPVYQGITYGIDDFILDSSQIARGKQAILHLEEQETQSCLDDLYVMCEDTLREGDILAIALYYPKRPDLVNSFQSINQQTGFRLCDGRISLPYLSSLEIEGLTLREARDKIQTAYNQLFAEIQVFVNFKHRQARQVQVIGAAHALISIDGQTRLSEVLAQAGLPSDANLFKSVVVREDKQLPLDLYQLVHEGDEKQNIVMRPGDQIFIAAASEASVMLMGEVFAPQVIPVPYGIISLREALTKAKGIPFTGDKNYIHVIRGEFVRPKVYCLKWEEIIHQPNHSLLLMPGDVVCVAEKPITQWNRFISQLQPGGEVAAAGYGTYQIFSTH